MQYVVADEISQPPIRSFGSFGHATDLPAQGADVVGEHRVVRLHLLVHPVLFRSVQLALNLGHDLQMSTTGLLEGVKHQTRG